MDLGLRERVYVVTGASRGLGFAAARVLVEEGARVVVSSRHQDAIDRAVSELGGGPDVVGVAADNADPETPARLLDTAHTAFGRLDGVLISVGGPPGGQPTAVGDDAWRSAFESVFLGATRLAREAAGRLADGGAMGFVLSTSVRAPIGGLAISNGLRPGLAMLAKHFADELGPRGIRVVSLLPGRIDTDRVRELDAAGGDAEAARAASCATIPLRRYGEPVEFGRVAAFALSPAASYLSGLVIPVDGGATRAL